MTEARNNDPIFDNVYLKIPEVASLFRISEKKIYSDLSKKVFPIKALKFGRQWRFHRDDVRFFIQEETSINPLEGHTYE